MAIIFGSDAGVREDAFGSFVNQISADMTRIANGIQTNFSTLTGEAVGLPPPPPRENVYVDDGFSNVPGTSFQGSQIENIDDFKRRRVTSQEPQATVYIQKRVFSSLKNENDTRYMDNAEKLLLRATKILFENKCSRLAAYEALTKVRNVLAEEAELDYERVILLATLLAESADDIRASINSDLIVAFAQSPGGVSQLIDIAEEEKQRLEDLIVNLQKIAGDVRKTNIAHNTTWVVDPDNVADVVNVGRGVGTIELTLVSNITTSLGLELDNRGSFSFTVQDPYNMSKISSEEIEVAISAALRERGEVLSSNGSAFENMLRGPQLILEEARRKERQLNRIRRDRINSLFSNFGVGRSPGVPLSGGDAAEIIFTINPSSQARNKVTVNSSASTEAFESVELFKLSLLQLPLEEQLSSQEDKLVTEIFDLLTNYVTQITRLSASRLEDNSNPDVAYARSKMRLYYLGKNFVQPMDSVHIFMRGNTFKDGQVLGPLNALLNGTSFIQSFAQDTNASDAILQEEMRQFGLNELNIPVSLYRAIRTSSFMRNAGTHVFGGLVSTVTESFSAGQGYQLRVDGQSNLKWLDMSRTNIQPGLDQSLRGALLEDPLTPFDLANSIDKATGLLLDEPVLLPDNQTNELIQYNSGIFRGKKMNSKNIKQDVTTIGNTLVPILHHAPGLVYRWKEGIITATINNNLRTALGGSPLNTKKLQRDMGINLTTNPFASMDAADIVSVLVTGFPHNYESFVLNTKNTGALAVGGTTNTPESFFHSFFDITRSANRALGNFQPYKTIKVTKDQMAERLVLQTDLRNNSKKIRDLRVRKAKLLDQLNSLENFPKEADKDDSRTENIRVATAQQINDLLKDVSNQLNQEVSNFYSRVGDQAAERSGLRVYGNDLAFELERELSEDDDQRENIRRIRFRNNLRVFRTQFDVKYNQDGNYFIVSDEYDKDLDIQAFALQMADKAPDLYKSGFETPYETCKKVAEKLDFEFFCDTQGHIQFRPPQYNKVPLSLLLKLILLDQNENKKLYPSFIESLFKNKQDSITNDIEITKFEIKIRNILLKNVSADGNQFRDAETSLIVDEATRDPLSTQFLGDGVSGSIDTSKAATELLNARNDLAAKLGNKPVVINDETLKAAAEEIDALNDPASPNVNARRLTKANELGGLQSKLQRLNNLAKRFQEQQSAFNSKSVPNVDTLGIKNTTRLTPNEINNLLLPFGDLIEDDFFDFLGPGSSSRYIITDEQILDYSFTESDQNVTMRVEVTGEQDLLKGSATGDIAGVPAIVAGATDFDLWRMYGYRTAKPVSKPYFKDAETQCAPYALMLLNRARRDVVRGSITVIGNEYYQLGDVVYINSRDMLYYVTRVAHNFSYDGGRFVTTLELRYGHPLGDYIATPLDVIGKNLIKNQTRLNRTISSGRVSDGQAGIHLGAVIFPKNSESRAAENINKEMLSGGLGKFNIIQLKNSLVKARQQMSKSQRRAESPYPIVEIRGYIVNQDQASTVKERMKVVKEWLMNPKGRFFVDSDKQIKLGDKFTDDEEGLKLQENEIAEIKSTLDPINLTNPKTENIRLGRGPNQEVFNYAIDKNDPHNIIEIVLILEEPTNIRDSIIFA